jgi:NAD-dependent deacetylase
MAGLLHPGLVILSGAGLSEESGFPMFRRVDGLWEGQRIEEAATPEAFQRQPERVHRFYNLRRAALKEVMPNAAHEALVRLERMR